jgi:hypothetical protein
VSAFNLRHCDASHLAGCTTQKPGTVTPFPQEGFEHDLSVAVDAPLHSVYVVYQKDDALVVVNTNVCNGSHRSACASIPPPAPPTSPTAITPSPSCPAPAVRRDRVARN